ncbi:hypothetical protein MNR01_06470 [Lysobacter sp. S4-A87]|uniref:hypothetical protein n=1 Tax=Lysobacter sp. S4-A87 TaxID=2925843 RepID=UPI001F53384A|nr:hypothetical protein [Lysobacter sp. S4-A87]UNK50645.1 hypothetical protein MNR01_06470 [Lysobacter sp. S4-A87]
MLRKIVFGFLWFIGLNVVIGLLIAMIAGMVAGAGETDPQKAFEAGRVAGASVAWLQSYVFVGSAIVSIIGAVKGYLPGTKRAPQSSGGA